MPDAAPILFLCEGDAETADSFSGSSRALVTTLRSNGRMVQPVDVLSYGVTDWLSKLVTVHPRRTHWAARHHYGPFGHRVRSGRAQRAVNAHPRGAPVIQIGATFDSAPPPETPLYFYCDANAAQGARGGEYSSVTSLSRAELAAMIERERQAYRRATGIFTISECLRQSFIVDFGVSPERVVCVHAGSNLRRVPSEQQVARFRKHEAPTILFIGRQFHRKGGEVLLRAFAWVRERIPDAKLLIAGSAPDVGDLSGVEVLGPIDPDATGAGSLEALYASADLFCMPSLYEPFGIVFVEAMLHGVPCIGTNAWAMPEIIDEGETGWLVPVSETQALADRLLAALQDRDRLRHMGAEARRRASARFSWELTVRRMLDYMERNEVSASRRPVVLAAGDRQAKEGETPNGRREIPVQR